MLSVEELLQPIDALQVAGRDLRYDSLIDTIQEARSEEDDSLPMGDWARQAKRADYPFVSNVTRNALLKESKDLWLAAWLGEATFKLEEYQALAAVLSLLLELQNRFWSTLYPEIEDGDLSLRAAPLHWALARYTKLLQELPVTDSGISYEMYKAVRSGTSSLSQGEDALTAEKLDAAIAATPKAFYLEASSALAQGLALVQELYLFCEEHYGEEGPSFVSFRAALEELQNLFSQLLRLKQAQEPDPEPPATLPSSEETELEPALYTSAQEKPSDLIPDPSLVETSAPTQQLASTSQEIQIHSWEEAMRRIAHCAEFVIEQQTAHPTAYLLMLALQYGREPIEEDAPSSETRIKLKKASDAGDWNVLLGYSLAVLGESFGRNWLDLYRYIWQASNALNAGDLSGLVLAQALVCLEHNPDIAEAFFADGTPVANPETRNWLRDEVLPIEPPSEERPTTPIPLQSALPAVETEDPQIDSYTAARDLASRGELTAAVRLLLTRNIEKRAARTDFLRRTQICQLLIESGKAEAALPLLRQLFAAIEEKHLEQWEEPEVLSEVFSLLLQALASSETDTEREAIYARLCRIDPARAITLQPIS